MAKFLTIGYGDREGYDRTAPELRKVAHVHDAYLQARGAIIGMAGAAVQVRNHDAAGTRTEPGPYLRSELPLAGFALIEANDLQEAIALVSKAPCAIAHGVVEVWPLLENLA